MFEAVTFFGPFGIVEPIERAHQVAGDAADAFELGPAIALLAVAFGATAVDDAGIAAHRVAVDRMID